MKTKSKWLVHMVTICLIFTLGFPVVAQVAAVESVNHKAVYLKQNQKGTCTLSATAMMLRRGALYQGSERWKNIRESTIRSTAWSEGGGLKWNFTYEGMSVKRAALPGGKDNKAYLRKLLANHPEGIVLYDRTAPHAVLLTDYTDGVFYCADPAKCVKLGRVPLSESYCVKLERASVIWYVEHQMFSADNVRYQMLHSTASDDDVQAVGMVDPGSESLVIPSTVTYQGKKYRVVRIAENAFRDNRTLSTLTIGKNVTSVGANAFAGVTGLQIENMDLPVFKYVGENAFGILIQGKEDWSINYDKFTKAG